MNNFRSWVTLIVVCIFFSSALFGMSKDENIIISGSIKDLQDDWLYSANNNSVEKKNAALHFAVELNKVMQAVLLLIDGAEVDNQDELGNTPLFYVSFKAPEMVELLLYAEADVNADGFILTESDKTEEVEKTKVTLLQKLCTQIRNKEEQWNNKIKKSMELLFQRGAHTTMGYNKKGEKEISCKDLLKRRRSIFENALTENGLLLRLLLATSPVPVMPLFVDELSSEALTFFEECETKRRDIQIKKNALLSAASDFVKSTNKDKIPVLLRRCMKECTLDVYDDEGKNPLHYAAKKRNLTAFWFFNHYNRCLITRKDKRGKTPEDYIRKGSVNNILQKWLGLS